jgi:hypothetical protein
MAEQDASAVAITGGDGAFTSLKVGVNAVWHAGNFAPGTAASKDVGTAEGNVPVLDGSGKLAESVLPAIAITDVNVVASEAAMLALTAQTGDIAVRSDLNKTFALAASPASTLANWIELRTPTDAVLSVAGRTGAITLTKGDVGLSAVDNTADANKPVSTAQQTALNLKANLGAAVTFGDITASRGDGTGVIYLGGAHYLYFDGANYVLPSAQLFVNGSQVWHAGNFDPASKATAAQGAKADSAVQPATLTAALAAKAGINDQTTTSATVFPIGTYLLGYNSVVDRAQTTTMSLFNTDNRTYSIPASGAALAGTWRACGSYGGNVNLMQRVA